MPRPKLTTLDQPPYPTPSASPTSPRSNPSTTSKPRLGQSILGQLLASHKGRDQYTLANDATLSLETIRPKEQRRSALPAGWAFGFSRTTTTPSSSTLNTVAPALGAISMANRKGKADTDHYQTVLPSAWLEKILAGLSKSRAEVPPHYATLPKDAFPTSTSSPRSVLSLFDNKGKSRPSKDTMTKPSSPKSKRWSDRSTPSLAKPGTLSSPVGALLQPGRPNPPHKLVRRSSACELALGEDARELFQQNRPKTLSSAVISSTIVKSQQGKPEKGSTSGSTVSTSSTSSSSSSSSSTSIENSEAPSIASGSVSGTPPTTTVTRGRFTIESSSSTPLANPMVRTRTLSTASTSSCSLAPVTSFSSSSHLEPPSFTPGTPGGSRTMVQPAVSLSPSPLSFSLPSSSMPARPSPSSRSFSVPCNTPPPSNGSTSSSSFSCSNPISIPHATKSNHQRTHSNSSVQSSGSTSSSRRSQIIIPVNTATFQFASFSSMASASSSSASSGGNVSPSPKPQVKRANSSHNNNFRNLSIHVLGKDTDDEEDTQEPGPESDNSQVFHLEPSSVHPLDHPVLSRANTSPLLHQHQTMNRVHPQQPHVHVHDDSTASMTRCGSFCCSSGRSSLNSLSSFGAEMPAGVEYGPACHAGYFRQRSLSTTHLDTSLYNNNTKNNNSGGSNAVSVPIPISSHLHSQHLQSRHSSSWSERPGRRTHGSLSHDAPNHMHHLHLHNRSSTPTLGHGPESSSLRGSFGETSDVVMVKKSATGRMFTVERTIPVSPTRCSRFIVVSAEEEAATAAANGGGSRSHTPVSSATH